MIVGGTTMRTRLLPRSHEPWKPHAYQTKAVNFLLNRGSAILFLDPGLGKTSIVLEAFSILLEEKRAKRMLVVAPKRVCELVWRQEGQKWSQFRHLKFEFLHGRKKDDLIKSDADVFLINPEGINWLATKTWGKRFPFDTVVIDELTRFKNAQAVRHKALLPRLSNVARRWGLTGTPVPNGYMDLFGQLLIIDDGVALGKYFTHFRNKYFESGYTGFDWVLRQGSRAAIEAAIKPYVLRMKAEDYIDMPDVVENIIKIQMSPKGRKAYEKMRKDTIVELAGERVVAANAAGVYSKLKQMANGAVYVTDEFDDSVRKVLPVHDDKIEALKDLVEELQGTPLLIGYEFNHDLDRIRAALGDIPHLGKGVTGAQAQYLERKWNRNEIPVMAAHPASAGHGLNFQGGSAHHLAWFSVTWDYELYDQFLRRLRRQGNMSARIFNHIFVVENTMDEKVLVSRDEKSMTQGTLLDALNDVIYREGESPAPVQGALGKEDNVVRKLSRRSKPRAEEPAEVEEVEEDEIEEEEAPRRTRRSKRPSRRSRAEEPVDEEEEEDETEEEEQPKPRRSSRSASKRKLRGKAAAEEDEADDDGEDDDDSPLPQKGKRAFSKAVQDALDGDEEDEDEVAEEAPKPKRRSKKAAPAKKTVGAGAGGLEDAIDVLLEKLADHRNLSANQFGAITSAMSNLKYGMEEPGQVGVGSLR